MSADTTQATHPSPAPVERRPAGAPPPDEAALAAAITVVDGLSIAWATVTAFEDPRALDAFGRAVTMLGGAPWYPQRLEVGTEGFLLGDHPVASGRDAAQRLARRLFAHGAGAIEIASPPTADDLLAALRAIAQNPGDQDPGDTLTAAGVRSIVLIHRTLLVAEGMIEDGDGGEPEGAWYLSYSGDPSRFVGPLVEDHPDDPVGAAGEFTDQYLGVLEMVSEEDDWARSEVVQAFVDAFTHLPDGHQVAVVASMLHTSGTAAETFLDQLGSQELGELAGSLDSDSQPLLVEYARIAAIHGERRHTELLSLLTGRQPDDEPLGTAIVSQVDDALRAGASHASEAAARLRRLRTSPKVDRLTAVNVTRGLFAIVDDEAFSRIAASWAERVAAAVAAGDLARSDLWFGAVLGVPLRESRQSTLLKALGKAFEGTVAAAAARVVTADPDGPGAGLRRSAPLFLAGPLIRHAAAADPDTRRVTIGALVTIARTRPAAVLPYLAAKDPMHLRIALLALGHTRSPQAAERIARLVRHPDPAVREQALRSLVRMRGPAAAPAVLAAIEDRSDRVRALATQAVRRLPGTAMDEAILARLERAHDQRSESAAIALLGMRRTPATRDRLEALAGARWAWGRRARTRRAAARRALEGDR